MMRKEIEELLMYLNYNSKEKNQKYVHARKELGIGHTNLAAGDIWNWLANNNRISSDLQEPFRESFILKYRSERYRKIPCFLEYTGLDQLLIIKNHLFVNTGKIYWRNEISLEERDQITTACRNGYKPTLRVHFRSPKKSSKSQKEDT